MSSSDLSRQLKLTSAIGITAGSVIGSGVFLVASDIVKAVPSRLGALSVWAVAGAISLAGGLIFAELGALFPHAGGQYRYLREAFPPWIGFLFGWTLALVIQSGSIAAVAVGFSRFLGQAWPVAASSEKAVAVALVVGVTALNAFGVREASRALDVITLLKALALAALAFLCIAPGAGAASPPAPGTTASAYGVALIAAFWAYDGWNNLGFVAGEIVDPKRNIPLAALLGILGVTALYLGANAAYLRWMSPAEIASSSFVAADVVGRAMGKGAVPWLVGLTAFSALGCVNGLTLGGARVLYAMGRDGSLPAWLGNVSARHAPTPALVAQMAWTILLILSGSYDQLFTYVVFAAFLFYGLTAVALLRLRKSLPEAERPYRVSFYPWSVWGYALFTAAFTLNAVVEKPKEAVAGLVILASGLPYYWWRRRTS